jgi:hypothetical protein
MLTDMMTRNSAHIVLSIFAVMLGPATACSDQGAVKTEAPRPSAAASATQAPPLLSARGDAAATLPPGHPPIDAGGTPQSALPAVPEGAGTGDAALHWTVPPGWVTEKPASPMRRAQYRVPGKAGDGECAVFYFGPGQGGDPMANAVRWAEQFTLPDGSSAQSAMKTSEIEVGGRKIFMVEVAGTYKGGMTMTAAPAVPKSGYRLLGAVAPGPDANWYFKFTGPDATVNEQREAFTSMVKSSRPAAS